MGSRAPSNDLLLALQSSLRISSRCPHLHHRPRIHLPYRPFHSSPSTRQKRKPKHKNLTKDELDRLMEKRAKSYTDYTDTQRAALAGKYNAQQMAAIDAGEQAITARDLAEQGRIRRDPLMPQYLDDFSRIEKVIDKKIEKLRGEAQDYDEMDVLAPMPAMHEVALGMDLPMMVEASRIKPPVRLFEEEEEIDDEDEDAEVIATPEEEEEDKSMEERIEERMVQRRKEQEYYEADADYGAALEFMKTPEGREIIRQQDESIDKFGDDLWKSYNAHEVKPKDVPRDKYPVDPSELYWHNPQKLQPWYTHPKYVALRDKHRNSFGFGKHMRDDNPGERNFLQGAEPDVAPEIPKIHDPSVRWEPAALEKKEDAEKEDQSLDNESQAAYERVAKSMGQTVKQLQKYLIKTLVAHRVVNQTRLGKIESVYNLVVAGDKKGMVGIGEGKATERAEAVRMARLNAIRNMVPILRYENRTIYGEVTAKSGASIVQLSARRPGFGVRTNSTVFEICRCAGIMDLAGRTPRSRNKMNMAKATWEALKAQRDPEEIAMGRGKKLVDVRKVYYSGKV